MIQRSEYYRKFIHLGNSIIPLGYWFILPEKEQMVMVLAVLTTISLIVDLGRDRIGWIKYVFNNYLDFMLRDHEKDGRFTGATWVFIASLVTVILFPKDLAVLALLFMAVGDTAAALVGIKWGRIRLGRKSLEGTVAGFLACLLVTLFFPAVPILVSIPGAAAAMAGELIPVELDDNLLIPLVAGSLMLGLRTLGI